MGFGKENHKVGVNHPQGEEQPGKPQRGQGLCLQVSTVLNCTRSEIRKQTDNPEEIKEQMIHKQRKQGTDNPQVVKLI